ncbi:Myosin light chain kinase 2, skeletal/cardiac muscle [Tulasnella sp. 427]|nr:Myosin light chain kinase 2, skeletal/cardiac muscle [Tulasnella sp. 427]
MRTIKNTRTQRPIGPRTSGLALPTTVQTNKFKPTGPEVPIPKTDLGAPKRKRSEGGLQDSPKEHAATRKKRRTDLSPPLTVKDASLRSKLTDAEEAAATSDEDPANSTAPAPVGGAFPSLGSHPTTGPSGKESQRFASGGALGNDNVSSEDLEVSKMPSSMVEAEALSFHASPIDADSPAPWIDFGHLRSLENPDICYHLKLKNDARTTRRLWVGSDKADCEIWVTGPDVQKYHCALELELSYNQKAQLRREVIVKRFTTPLSPPNVIITLWTDQEDRTIKHDIILQDGAVIQFGNGDLFEYTAPKYMHQHNITHRDLKPENILVVVSDSGHVSLKIIDLGLARLSTEPVPTRLWHLGTRKWMSPAAFRMYPDDRFADCYGVGRLLHFILTASKWIAESHDPRKICGCTTPCKKTCAIRHAALEAVVPVGGRSCVDFLKHLLVPFPDQCMDTSRMLEHGYLAASSNQSE